MQYGCIGEHLTHSFSKEIHALLQDYLYELQEIPMGQLDAFMTRRDFQAINVTIPYKQDVIPFLEEIGPTAATIGAVNTIVRQPDGTLIGHNTDYFGFLSTIKKTGLAVNGKKALVLGSGGASVTAVAVLEELGAAVVCISRSGENNYSNLNLHWEATLIVNVSILRVGGINFL